MNRPLTVADTGMQGKIVPTDDEAEQARADAIAVIEDHRGVNAHRDWELMRRLFSRLGWDMLTDEALAILAGSYEDAARFSERLAAENRAIHAQEVAEGRAL